MTRFELLHLLVGQARLNGFQFRRWYAGWLGLTWEGPRQAVQMLSEQRRYYALLFSQEFAESFWKSGEQMTVQVANHTFQRNMPNGTVGIVVRKCFTRRRTRPNAWRYHLRQMAVAEDPLRYARRFLRIEDDLESEPHLSSDRAEHSDDSRFITDPEDLLTD